MFLVFPDCITQQTVKYDNFYLRVVIFKNSKISSSNTVYNMRILKNQTGIQKYLTATQLHPVSLNRVNIMNYMRKSSNQIMIKFRLGGKITKAEYRIAPMLCNKTAEVDRMI